MLEPVRYLMDGEGDVVSELRLRVDGLSSSVVVTLQEQVFEDLRVLLLERHHHLVTESKQDQLKGTRNQ